MNAIPDAGKPATKANYVQIRNVTKVFDDVYAVDDVSLDISQGEIFALLGSSGCGKSTLLRMLAGFEAPTSGSIFIDGVDMSSIPPYRRPVNMMFQSYALFPHMTVEQNVAFGLKQEGVPRRLIADRVQQLLKLVRMQPYARRKPDSLSGGQRQRVALARSLVKQPKLLLLDEPMAALDKKLREQMQLELVDIIESVGVTCVMVTHDQHEAMTMANRIGVMDEGRILQIGTPTEIYEMPNCRFTAGFVGSVNLFEGRVVEDEPGYVVIQSEDLPQKLYIDHGITGTMDMQVWVAVRPEKILVRRQRPESEYNWLQGKVRDIAYFGSHSIYHVALPGGRVVMAHVSNQQRDCEDCPTWEDEVFLSWEGNSGVVLTR
ncbi:MAG: polyamine ABC transporter ATP-binding protein [Thiogranum sp.]|nr:polyamine ABC transporter ATP-binding protein [Thiogranum sp.]